jgi:hypothetical protein
VHINTLRKFKQYYHTVKWYSDWRRSSLVTYFTQLSVIFFHNCRRIDFNGGRRSLPPGKASDIEMSVDPFGVFTPNLEGTIE